MRIGSCITLRCVPGPVWRSCADLHTRARMFMGVLKAQGVCTNLEGHSRGSARISLYVLTCIEACARVYARSHSFVCLRGHECTRAELCAYFHTCSHVHAKYRMPMIVRSAPGTNTHVWRCTIKCKELLACAWTRAHERWSMQMSIALRINTSIWCLRVW